MERKFKNNEIPVYEIGFVIPPKWCSSVCENALSDICMEECALKKDCSGLKLRKGATLEDLPEFPLNEFINEMTPKQRTACVGIYLAKLSEGVQDEPIAYSKRGISIPAAEQVTGLLDDPEKEVTVYQAVGEADSNKPEST